jgi:hypothetical protein
MSTNRPTKKALARSSKSKVRRRAKPEPTTATKAPLVERVDGRARRATGRTLRFGATVHPDWKAQLDRIADRLGVGVLYVQVLEQALDALERELDQEDEVEPPSSAKGKKAASRKAGSRRRRSR